MSASAAVGRSTVLWITALVIVDFQNVFCEQIYYFISIAKTPVPLLLLRKLDLIDFDWFCRSIKTSRAVYYFISIVKTPIPLLLLCQLDLVATKNKTGIVNTFSVWI